MQVSWRVLRPLSGSDFNIKSTKKTLTGDCFRFTAKIQAPLDTKKYNKYSTWTVGKFFLNQYYLIKVQISYIVKNAEIWDNELLREMFLAWRQNDLCLTTLMAICVFPRAIFENKLSYAITLAKRKWNSVWILAQIISAYKN